MNISLIRYKSTKMHTSMILCGVLTILVNATSFESLPLPLLLFSFLSDTNTYSIFIS